jgi:PncC family amidohydrolase
MNLNKNVVALLKRKKMKISFAESCTGGLLSSAITSVDGSSEVFTMGLVTYSNQAKTKVLKIPKNIIKKNGAVSMQCCLAMANNLSKISKSKICISITGIAGPKGGTQQKPVGLVYIGIKKGKTLLIKENRFKSKKRNLIQTLTVKVAIKTMLKLI